MGEMNTGDEVKVVTNTLSRRRITCKNRGERASLGAVSCTKEGTMSSLLDRSISVEKEGNSVVFPIFMVMFPG